MQHGWPALYTLLLWWVSTGVILYLNGLPRSTHKWTMAAMTVLLGLALLGVASTAAGTGVRDAYLSFTAAMAVWAWQETGFLLGYVTGPRRSACPVQASGWPRAGHAFMAILHHELALVVLGAAVLALCWGQPNQLAVWTFAALWLMRLSAKLNVFLGVRNLNAQFLPEHLRYMQTYFRQRPGNAWFPVSVLAATGLTVAAWHQALRPNLGDFDVAACSLLAMLLSLALLEHWFMVLPLPSEKLWNWGLRSRTTAANGTSDTARQA
jgi:putative photosynthetic complex assembly protein 2